MQFLAIIRRRTEAFTEAQFAEMLGPEAARVRELYAEGIVRAAHGRGDLLGAVLQLEAADEAEARRALDSLPLLQRGMLELQMLIPLRPYRGFGPG